jgi:hypothetical protein
LLRCAEGVARSVVLLRVGLVRGEALAAGLLGAVLVARSGVFSRVGDAQAAWRRCWWSLSRL